LVVRANETDFRVGAHRTSTTAALQRVSDMKKRRVRMAVINGR
jgi:hypothetical protein